MVSNKKRKDIIQLLLVLIILISINILSYTFFTRIDLTSENRYSLTDASKQIAKKLDDIVYVKVYLDGDLPAGFQRLKNETKEMLDEFKNYSNGNIEFEFINPTEIGDKNAQNTLYQSLYEKGLLPTDLEVQTEDGVSNKIIWPGAIVSYKGKEIAMQILKSQMGAHPEVMLNNSIQQLEYEIAHTIKKLTGTAGGKIAFIEGHGELSDLQTMDITKSLSELYTVERVRLNGDVKALNSYEAIIIAKPDSIFNDADKFTIDQFIMRGGKAIWLVDMVQAEMDSLQSQNTTMGLARNLRIEDQLFKYGVRINPNLVLDIRSMPIPIVTGYVGNQPRQEFFPWFFFPLLVTENLHPIVNNVEGIKTEFVSSIDTIANGVKKTPLLFTSKYSKIANTPTRISLNMLRTKPDEKQFNSKPQIIAVLLEGEFESVFKNRIAPANEEGAKIGIKDKSIATKQIVIADGDIIKNGINKKTGEYLPLEYDKFTKQEYGNKDLILNCVNYLCDDSGLISSRSKQFKIRLLDSQKIKNEELKWQVINVVFPIILLLSFGLILYFVRKKRFGM